MQDTVFEDVLLAPRAHQAEVLTTASDEEWSFIKSGLVGLEFW